MFKLNETYMNGNGQPCRVICVDAGIVNTGGKTCNIVAVCGKEKTNPVFYYFDDEGKLSGVGNSQYNLISDDPSESEKELIRDMLTLAEDGCREDEKEERLLKIIRTLRGGKK